MKKLASKNGSRLTKSANGNFKFQISHKDWKSAGIKAGWIDQKRTEDDDLNSITNQTPNQVEKDTADLRDRWAKEDSDKKHKLEKEKKR